MVRDRTSSGSEPATVREGAPRTAGDGHLLRPGTELVDRYRVLAVLGRGGWGVVYRAHDLELELDIALKLLHPEAAADPVQAQMFRNEVRIARRVTHPNVCRLHDLVASPDGCFITMEYVAGEPLSARLARGRLAPGEAHRVLRDVTAGLAAAHTAGVIHRDLKPANVLVADDRALIADFGVAYDRRAIDRMLDLDPPRALGTRGYMAPEQATGAPIDARVDVYALGLLGVILLTGQRPPTAATGTISDAEARAPASLDPAVLLDAAPAGSAPAVVALIRDCLAIAPADRPRDAGEVLERLAHAA
ncbi:MAG TPA: serine/threonine-protein kinase [Kofleriaceae bacterium]|nr:serine/threonine-protein kinase [Kofleriaceae bacterium]